MKINTPFEYLDNIFLKGDIINDDKIHNKYARLVLYFLSHHERFIHIANDLNKFTYTPRQIYDILYNLIPNRKVFIQYPKRNKINEENIKTVMEYYNCKRSDAMEYLKIISKEYLNEMERQNSQTHSVERF